MEVTNTLITYDDRRLVKNLQIRFGAEVRWKLIMVSPIFDVCVSISLREERFIGYLPAIATTPQHSNRHYDHMGPFPLNFFIAKL